MYIYIITKEVQKLLQRVRLKNLHRVSCCPHEERIFNFDKKDEINLMARSQHFYDIFITQLEKNFCTQIFGQSILFVNNFYESIYI